MDILNWKLFSSLRELNQKWEEKRVQVARHFFNWCQRKCPREWERFEKIWLRPKLFNLPNCLTLIRLVSIAPLLYFFSWQNLLGNCLAFITFLIISLTDLLDGMIAKVANCQTSYGSIIDPTADKLLIILVMVVQNHYHQLLWWLLIWLVIIGEIIYSSLRFYKLFKDIQPYGSNYLGKGKFVLQVGVICLLLLKIPSSYQLLVNALLITSLLLLYTNIIQEVQKLFWTKSKIKLPIAN